MSIFDWLKKADELEKRELAKTGDLGGDANALEQRVIQALRTVYDPEIPVNIYDLGLVYDLAVDDTAAVHIRMTLTAPGCPVAQTFPGTVEQAVKSVPGVTDAWVELVWDPPWSREKMSEASRLELGML
jgi:FeS assembly SUF system protein